MSLLAGRARDETGSATASFVVVFPVLIVMFMALVQWGLYFHAQSLVDSIEGRDQWLASGMQTGIDQGYAKLDALIAELQ